MQRLPCPYLQSEVELTEERERHITRKHPDLLPEHRQRIAEALADPDQVRRSSRAGRSRLFCRWYDDLKGGKHVVVVVVSEKEVARHWVITAYLTRRLTQGALEWEKS